MIHDGLSQDVEPNQSRGTPHDIVANMHTVTLLEGSSNSNRAITPTFMLVYEWTR